MCEACSPPSVGHYEGNRLILETPTCRCECPVTVYESTPPRCHSCNHLVKIELSDDWKDPFIWIDPLTKHPVIL